MVFLLILVQDSAQLAFCDRPDVVPAAGRILAQWSGCHNVPASPVRRGGGSSGSPTWGSSSTSFNFVRQMGDGGSFRHRHYGHLFYLCRRGASGAGSSSHHVQGVAGFPQVEQMFQFIHAYRPASDHHGLFSPVSAYFTLWDLVGRVDYFHLRIRRRRCYPYGFAGVPGEDDGASALRGKDRAAAYVGGLYVLYATLPPGGGDGGGGSRGPSSSYAAAGRAVPCVRCGGLAVVLLITSVS